jgi:hypothetical protein
MAQLERQTQQPTLEPSTVHDAKSLICALNLVSRNLPLPPDLHDAVSSICFSPEDSAINASSAGAGAGAGGGGGGSGLKVVPEKSLVTIL